MDAILELHNLLPEQNGLNSPKLKGIESKRKKATQKMDIGQIQKVLSNVVVLNDDDFDEKELYNQY
jgi:hypothetical protein